MRVLVCAFALLLSLAATAAARPSRVVSLDYCADQYVLALADRDQIAALSVGALRDDSYYRPRARGLRRTRGTLEEALALRPDLIVRNWGGPWDAEAVYARFGVPVLKVGDATDFNIAREDLRDAARVLGQQARGAALIADLDIRLARLRAEAPRQPPPVMYLSAAGATGGRGVMIDAVIQAAGGRNAWNGDGWTVLPLERLTQTPPALIALGFFDSERETIKAWAPARHPVLRRALARSRTVNLPPAAISCEAWYAIDAAERIAAAMRGAA